jgi:predicted DNA-binding transcriptional regulator AlpA
MSEFASPSGGERQASRSARSGDADAAPGNGPGLQPKRTADSEAERLTLLNAAQVADSLGISKRTLWRMVSTGEFPQPIRFGQRNSRWLWRTVADFIQAKAEQCSDGREVRK